MNRVSAHKHRFNFVLTALRRRLLRCAGESDVTSNPCIHSRGNDLPLTEYACEGESQRKYTRILTWKTTCVSAVKAAFIKSFLECMPDLRYVFFTDKGIAKFLDEYAKESGIEGMDEAVRKMSSSRSNHGLKLAEMSLPLLLEKFGGLA